MSNKRKELPIFLLSALLTFHSLQAVKPTKADQLLSAAYDHDLNTLRKILEPTPTRWQKILGKKAKTIDPAAIKNQDGETPLFLSADPRDLGNKTLRYLLAHGAQPSINTPNKNGDTPLSIVMEDFPFVEYRSCLFNFSGIDYRSKKPQYTNRIIILLNHGAKDKRSSAFLKKLINGEDFAYFPLIKALLNHGVVLDKEFKKHLVEKTLKAIIHYNELCITYGPGRNIPYPHEEEWIDNALNSRNFYQQVLQYLGVANPDQDNLLKIMEKFAGNTNLHIAALEGNTENVLRLLEQRRRQQEKERGRRAQEQAEAAAIRENASLSAQESYV